MQRPPRIAQRLRGLVLAIGDEGFSRSLFLYLNATASADHCLIFRFRFGYAPSCVINCGELGDDGLKMAQLYVRGLYSMDSTFPQVLSIRDGAAPVVLYPERAMSTVFKERFVEAFGVSDMAGLGVAAENARYYALLLKTQGARFSQSDHCSLASNADVTGAVMTKHFFYKFRPERTPAVSLDLVLGGEADFADVTERERDMCRGILQGSSSKEIASDLGISVNSVLTYRKRLYQRLGISSQHELFARVLRATLYKRARAV